MASTPEQVANKIACVRKRIAANQSRIEIAALKRLEGEMKGRIFNDGKATDGSAIGRYVSDWKKIRERAGRQIGFVDLQFDGDLKNGIQVGKEGGNNNTLGFTRTKERLKADGHETYRKKKIFKPTKTERKILVKSIGEEIRTIVAKCFQ